MYFNVTNLHIIYCEISLMILAYLFPFFDKKKSAGELFGFDMLKTLHDAFKNLKAILLGKLEAIQLRFLFFLSYYPLSVTLCGGALLFFCFCFLSRAPTFTALVLHIVVLALLVL